MKLVDRRLAKNFTRWPQQPFSTHRHPHLCERRLQAPSPTVQRPDAFALIRMRELDPRDPYPDGRRGVTAEVAVKY